MNGDSKKLYRTEGNAARIAGVCGGVSEYFGVDPNVVRLLWVGFFFLGTAGFWVYLAAALILPKKSTIYPGY